MPRPASPSRRSPGGPPRRTGSSSPASISRSAARATYSERTSPACAPAWAACGCSATRRPSSRPARRRPRWSPRTPTWRAGHCSPPRWTYGSRTARVSSWRGHDADHRGIRRRPPVEHTTGPAHAPDERPGPGGAVLRDRGLVRVAVRPPVPRPVRRVRRGGARSPVARSRGGDARRAGQAHRRPHHRQRPDARLRADRGARRQRRQHPRPDAGGAVRRGLPRPALPGAERGGGGRTRRPRGAGVGLPGRPSRARAGAHSPRAPHAHPGHAQQSPRTRSTARPC